MTADSEVMRLSRLVDSLLKLSRLENRANPNKKEIVDVGEVVAGIIATHEAYVRESGLTLTYRADDDVIILGDPDLIRQATANLISNAVRYTDEGGSIYVRVKRGESMAQISVKDTGIGLTPEEARMVFQRFWRADSGRDRESGGLGVGLTVVKEIVERHDGWVQVEGRKGEGACFTIHIPLYDEREQRRKNSRNTGRMNRVSR
jgi:signal transduction histidine kinase